MKRRTRLAAALVAMIAILFAPLAMALHACHAAQMSLMAGADLAVEAGADDAAAPPPMDELLCQRHCHQEKLSVHPAVTPPAALDIPVIGPLRVDALEPVSLRVPAFDSPFAAAAGPAPPLIGFTVLRI